MYILTPDTSFYLNYFLRTLFSETSIVKFLLESLKNRDERGKDLTKLVKGFLILLLFWSYFDPPLHVTCLSKYF